MSANIKLLKTRIKSVDSTLHLTRAMQLVAASKIRKATEKLTASRSYLNAFETVMAQLASSSECASSPFLKPRSGKRTILIVIAGDRGLAGGYNAGVFRKAAEAFSPTVDGCDVDTVCNTDADIIEVIPIGKRAFERWSTLTKRSYGAEAFTAEECAELCSDLCKRYLNNEFDRLLLVSTEYISVMQCEAHLSCLLPIEKPAGKPTRPAEFEPNSETVLNSIIPEYICSLLFGAVRESFACEVAARRVAMDSATKNASIMMDDLQLEYNRARQSAITQELTEIIAGADAKS